MRLFLLILATFVTLSSIGCNSDLKCRRETALLRAEYLDLEDKYYALVAQTGNTTTPPLAASAIPASSETIIPGAQPVVYGSGVQQPFVTHAAQPEIVYYDQAGGYPVEGQTYYAPQYDQSIGYDPYGQPLEFGETPTPAAPRESADGSSLRSSQSVIEGSEEDYYYPSPVENLDQSEPSLDEFEEDSLPTPDTSFDDKQSRFDIEIENTHEIGHEVKIEMSSPITEVVINKSVSQGKDSDGRPGDEGIELLIQPKSASGSVVDEAGNLTVSVIDPAADQGERQIGEWTFLKQEAELFFAEDEFDNRGILLNLKWDKIVPTNKRLTVYVRFETPDGRTMETTSDIIIDPPSKLTLADQSEHSFGSETEFIQLQRDEDQGWYKGQTSRGQTDSDLNWGRSTNAGRAGDYYIRDHQIQRVPRQPQWRPAR